jgi:zinc transporter ZupT
MPVYVLPLGMLLASLGGSALSLVRHGRADKQASSWMDGLYPVSAAFFLGFLVTTLLPHLIESPWSRIPAFAVGYAVMALWSRRVVHHDPCCEVGHDPHPIGAASALAMSICSLNDGLLLGLLQPHWFSGINLGMLLHKITSSFALAHLLSQSSRTKTSLWSWSVVYALISPATYFLAKSGLISEGPWLGTALGFSAGILAYSIWTGMLPHSRRILKQRPMAMAGFVIALVLSLGLGVMHGALHHH